MRVSARIQRERLRRLVNNGNVLVLRKLSVSNMSTLFFFSIHLEEINMCESNPCTNGGTCSTMGSSYHCLCVEGFRGINCQGKGED